ncbi:MAG TPA: BTAD domain-containing putative transcriptional regulator [Pseudonocardia sp.]|nr:BTAD domain-containing putative transcriptional regulator [Pseudonocardia sp.]
MTDDRAVVTLRVLGGFDAAVRGRAVPLGGPRQRAVLARVLVGGGTAVPVDSIVTDVWGGHAPSSTVASVHAYVSRLRRVLGERAVVRRGGGYVIDRAVLDVDADCFVDEVGRGRQAFGRGADEQAVDLLGTALARWSSSRAFGELGDLAFVAAEATRLEDLRLVAAEALADSCLRLGRGGEVVELLEDLVRGDPLREPLVARLVRALAAAGRQAAALATYDRCRRALADHLGVDPGSALREVHAAVLGRSAAGGPGGADLPVRLPPRNRSFVGREDLLDRIGRDLDADHHQPRAVALCGLAGVGKTETAAELVHRRRRPGRLAWWIPAADPATTAAGLADLAAALGVDRRGRDEESWTALWDALDRRPGWTLVFDNADEPDLLKPLLPAARHGDIVITSRNPAWRELARPVAVPPLTRAEATTYVGQRTGDDDPTGAATLSELLGDLPLALGQACAFIEQAGMTVHDYVGLFRRHRAALLMRATGGGHTVATTWGLAFDRLRTRSPRAAEVLETIAFLCADAIAVDMLAPLVEDEIELQDVLGELLRLSLVDRKGASLRMHRLVQDVARARLDAERVRRRLARAAALAVAHHDRTGSAATHLITVAAHGETLGAVPDGLTAALAGVAQQHAGRALYPAAERVLRQALRLLEVAAPDDPGALGELVCRLGEVLDAAGRLPEALELHQRAVQVLEGAPEPDPVLLARAYNRLGHVLNCADRCGEAISAHERAVAALGPVDRADLLAPVLIDFGFTLWAAHRLEEAGQTLRAGREHLERQGRRESREWAHATEGLGMVAQDGGDAATAIALQRTAIAVFTRVCGGDHPDTAQAYDKLGYALRLEGDAAGAVDAHRRAVRALERVLGATDTRVGMALTNLGLALADAGRGQDAVDAQSRAHTIFRTALGTQHASTVLAARRLAVALTTSGRRDAGRALLGEVLETALSRAGDDAAELARIEADTASVLGTGALPTGPGPR